MTDRLDVVIVGAGVAGIAMAAQLERAGVSSYAIIERANAIGGTWRDNTYPGAGCDVPSHLYCFSFAPNPDWSRKFAEQEEILAYLQSCVDRFGLRDKIRLSTTVERAEFDADGACWRIATSGGAVEARFLIAGCGQLGRPWTPPLEGLDQFEGTSFHSARWNHDLDLNALRIAVVGNGASAIQFVPRIAPLAKHITVFQRSAHWIVPKPDRAYAGLEKWLFRRFPFFQRLHRQQIYWQLEARFFAFQKGSAAGRYAKRMARAELERVSDPALRARLTPDYTVGCKRILISNDYYETLERPNVSVETQPIDRVHPAEITCGVANHPTDVIIFATGFATTEFLAGLDIVAEGRRLHETWRDGAEAHLGITVSGFPNMFLLYGPNTNLGHNSIIFMIECQVRYIIKCLAKLKRRGGRSIEVRADVQRRYNRGLQDSLGRLVWSADCSSWYKDDAGRITNNWASFAAGYWWHTRRVRISDFHVA